MILPMRLPIEPQGILMQRFAACLWFDGKAEEAARSYTRIVMNSCIGKGMRYGKAGPGPEGSVLTVAFQLQGRD